MISLYGALARRFEKKYQVSAKNIPIQVTSTVEMLRALDANFKGFRAMLKRKGAYRITRGQALTHGKNVDPVEIEMNFGEKDWHIMPVAAGCKSAVGRFIFGGLLVLGSFFIPGLAPVAANMMFGMGVSMMLGGVAQMLAPSPATGNYADREKEDSRPSYLSQGPVNAVEPGLTLPVAYGDCWLGSITVSAGMKVENI